MMCDYKVCKIQYSHPEVCCYCISTAYIRHKHTDAHMLSRPFSIKITQLHSLSLSAEQQAFQ